MHINNEYALDGNLEPKELFVQTEVTDQLEDYEQDLERDIGKMFEVIKGNEPEFKVEDLQTIEYDNLCKDEFMNSLPEDNVFQLYRMLTKKKVGLCKEGCIKIKDVPESVKLNDKQAIQRRLACDGGKHINKQGISNFLNNLKYPIYYLDFETINPAIPKFDRMTPYQRIPFQFSLHIQEKQGGGLKHISFLAEGTTDPRPKFMQALKDNLSKSGSVLVYNQGFEKGVLNEGCNALPEFREWYDENILPRIKDLWDVLETLTIMIQCKKEVQV